MKVVVRLYLAPGHSLPDALPLPPPRPTDGEDTNHDTGVLVSCNWHSFTAKIFDSQGRLLRQFDSCNNAILLAQSFMRHKNSANAKRCQSSFLFGYTNIFYDCQIQVERERPQEQPTHLHEVREGNTADFVSAISLGKASTMKEHAARVKVTALGGDANLKLRHAHQKLYKELHKEFYTGSICMIFDKDTHWMRDADMVCERSSNPIYFATAALGTYSTYFDNIVNYRVNPKSNPALIPLGPSIGACISAGMLNDEVQRQAAPQIRDTWAYVQACNPPPKFWPSLARTALEKLKFDLDFGNKVMGELGPVRVKPGVASRAMSAPIAPIPAATPAPKPAKPVTAIVLPPSRPNQWIQLPPKKPAPAPTAPIACYESFPAELIELSSSDTESDSPSPPSPPTPPELSFAQSLLSGDPFGDLGDLNPPPAKKAKI